MSGNDADYLLDILDAARKIVAYTARFTSADHFFADQVYFDATLMNFIVIGESVSRISDELQDTHSEVPWRKIQGLRNVIAHDYFGIDAEELWQIAGKDIPELIRTISTIIPD